MLITNVNSAEVPTADDTYTAGVQVTLCFSAAEMAAYIANYDPDVGTSPSIGDCRPVLRAILNAYLEVSA